MNEIIAVGLVTLLAVMSPGADFALVSRNSYLYGRPLGLSTAYGIACGVWVHVAYSVIGLKFLQQHIPGLIQVIQYIGATYLIYIGYKIFTQAAVIFKESHIDLTRWQAFKHGFFTNSLNPKTTLFVMSIYSQLMSSENSNAKLLGYGLFMSASHLLWFCLIALFCATPSIRNKILSQQIIINRLIGIVLSGLGCSLFIATF